MIEEWKDIKDFEGQYRISNLGRVKSVARIVTYKNTNQTGIEFEGCKICKERILKTYIRGGYEHIGLKRGSKNLNYAVHRLVAEYFIANPDNLPIINHKDENKLNNRVDNLEWCDVKYNANYGTRNERIAEKLKEKPEFYIPVLCYDLNNNFVKSYESATQAGAELKVSPSGITACCKMYEGRASAAGFKWKYAKSDIDISTIQCLNKVKEIHQFDCDGEYITTYKSLSEAATIWGKHVSNFRKAIQKGNAYGYVWAYDENLENVNELLHNIYERDHHIYQIDVSGNIMDKFTSGLQAQEKTGIHQANISFAMRSKTPEGKLFRRAGDYYWVDVRTDPDYEIDFNFKRRHGEKKVFQYDLDDNLLNVFDSIADAQEYLGLPRNRQSAIYDCFKPNTKKTRAYGYVWKR